MTGDIGRDDSDHAAPTPHRRRVGSYLRQQARRRRRCRDSPRAPARRPRRRSSSATISPRATSSAHSTGASTASGPAPSRSTTARSAASRHRRDRVGELQQRAGHPPRGAGGRNDSRHRSRQTAVARIRSTTGLASGCALMKASVCGRRACGMPRGRNRSRSRLCLQHAASASFSTAKPWARLSAAAFWAASRKPSRAPAACD